MFKRNTTPTETSQPVQAVERITSVLGSGVVWHGSINGSGGVRIEGAFEGEIAMLEDEQKKLGEEMTAASIAGDDKRVKALENQYAELHDMLSSRYQEWSASAG